MDGWDFKQYVLGTLFYRFISENFSLYIEAGDESIRYAKLADSSYVEAEDTRERVDIAKFNAELETTVVRIDQLRSEIDAIVAKIEG